MKSFVNVFATTCAVLFFTNCASSSVGVSPSNRPLPNQTYETIKSVEKVYSWYAFDIIVYGASIGTPPMTDIYSDLMQGEEADAIVNLRYYNDKSVFGFITRYRFGIKGDLVRFTGGASSIGPGPKKK